MTRRTLIGLTVSAGAGVLAGCTTDPDNLVPRRYVEGATIEPDAEALGAGRAQAAADWVVEFTLTHGTKPALLDPQRTNFAPADLIDPVIGSMTPETAETFRGMVADALNGDRRAIAQIDGLEIFGLYEPAWSLPRKRDAILNQQITDLVVGAGDQAVSPGSMRVRMEHRSVALFDTRVNSIEVEFQRRMAYELVPTDDPSVWLIETWRGPYDVEVRDGIR